nr:glutamate-5-semialdehyde dehydrogenase [Pseudonocardia spinosispora]
MSSSWTPRLQSQSHEHVAEGTRRARAATDSLRSLQRPEKDAALHALAAALLAHSHDILEANALDVAAARDQGVIKPRVDRLTLTQDVLETLAYGLQTVAALPDPVGEVIRGSRQRTGVEVCQIRVPIGVVAVLHEGQPSIIVQALGQLLKTGNAVLLFDAHESSTHTDKALVRVLRDALKNTEVLPDAIQLVSGHQRAVIRSLIITKGAVDLVIPLLQNGIPAQLLPEAAVPIVHIGSGNCHIYVDAAADLELATRVVLDSKVGHAALSHAVETVLVHADVAEEFIPKLHAALQEHGVTVHADERFAALAPGVTEATEHDWDSDYRTMHLAAAVVDSSRDAIAHIARHGTGHTECVISADMDLARAFAAQVDAATVAVNTPTTFSQSATNLMDPELAFSTQRLRPRGPLGMSDFTTTKWLAWPSAQNFNHLPQDPRHAEPEVPAAEPEPVAAVAQHVEQDDLELVGQAEPDPFGFTAPVAEQEPIAVHTEPGPVSETEEEPAGDDPPAANGFQPAEMLAAQILAGQTEPDPLDYTAPVAEQEPIAVHTEPGPVSETEEEPAGDDPPAANGFQPAEMLAAQILAGQLLPTRFSLSGLSPSDLPWTESAAEQAPPPADEPEFVGLQPGYEVPLPEAPLPDSDEHWVQTSVPEQPSHAEADDATIHEFASRAQAIPEAS